MINEIMKGLRESSLKLTVWRKGMKVVADYCGTSAFLSDMSTFRARAQAIMAFQSMHSCSLDTLDFGKSSS